MRTPQLCLAALATGIAAGVGDLQAQSYTWNDTSNAWNAAGSWNGAGTPPPNLPGESAIFGAALVFVVPTISISPVEVDGITFTAAAPIYTITTAVGGDLTISGPGITNNSAVTQVIANTGGNLIGFENNATAGSGITINNSSADAFLSFNFFTGGSANAGTATINNSGTSAFVVFDSTSSAAGSTINNSGTDSVIRFFSNSTAGASTINNTSDSGLIDFLDSSSAGTSFINNSADFTVGAGGIQFSGNSTAANSTIVNIVANSNTAFSDATAGNALITNQGDDSNTIFRAASTAGGATIENQGFATFTQFEDTSSAGSATITNTGDFSYIQFLDNTNAGSSTLINDALTDAFIIFDNNSSAAGATILNLSDFGVVSFFTNSNAGSATIVNSGASTSTTFDDSSSAMNATITNSGGFSATIFADMASGGAAALINANPTAFIDISQLTTPGTTAGSIAGNGALYLGSKNLTVGLNNSSTTFSGVIQDGGFVGGFGGSLTKVGLGTLTLTGANTYTGDTVVDAGALIVNGSIASPNTFVNVAGLLGGMGTIGGNLTNRGTVEPGNTPAGLSVNGTYTQTSTGDLRINISSNTTFGKLKVGGVANLDGSVTAVVRDGFKPKRGDTFTFLTANGGVNGEFDELNTNLSNGTILEFDLIYRSNSVSLEVAQGSFREFADENGLTVNQKSVASALDKVAFDKRERRLIDYLNQRSLNDLPGDFDRIAPDELASIYDISFALANVQSLHLQRRTDDIRRGSTGFSAAGLAMNGTGPSYSGPMQFSTGSAGPTGNESKESKSVAIPEESKWGVFLSGVGEWVDVDGDGNARGYEISTGGFTVGIDYKVNPNFAVGLSAGYAGTGADLSDDGRVFVNGGKLGLYATYFTGGFYLDAGLNGGYNSYDTKRSALAGTARGDTEGLEFNALLGTGYDFTIGNLRVGPTATVQYTNVQIDEFKESGSLAPLQIEDQNAESLRTAIGFRASYDIQLRNGMIIRPELRAAWQHEFADRRFALDSRFASGAGSVFTVYGPEYGRDSLLLSAGLTLLLNERTALFLSYDGQLARTDYDSHAVSGGVRVSF